MRGNPKSDFVFSTAKHLNSIWKRYRRMLRVRMGKPSGDRNVTVITERVLSGTK
jgi:hypothetical protein